MTDAGVAGISVRSANSAFIEWGAVIAGAVLAAALSFVLLTFLTAVGLTAVSPWPNSGMSATATASLAAFFVFLQQIGSFMAGGYVAGRMRARWAEADEDEVSFRDGLHGGLVWAVGVVIGAAMLVAAGSATARLGGEAVGFGVSQAAENEPMAGVLDTLLRPANPAQAADSAEAAAAPTTTTPAPEGEAQSAAVSVEDRSRAEMGRILSAAVTSGSLSDQDRPYLASLVAARTGLSQAEAEKRVDEAVTAAREAADKARRGAALVGFITAASLILSLGAAWWAATRGGHHRDNAVPARFAVGTLRRPVSKT